MSRIDLELAELKERVACLEEQVSLYQQAPKRGSYIRWFLTGFLTIAGLMVLGLFLLGIIQFIAW
ncbi:hypothetical protein [Paenibacillus lentus]|uniref:Uncharacterized protein n=1 Tax=Paenibacillus lentus TaxID=1338368 RepID=A0A3Q8S5V5_9BACL|nr:hypothetical protein [Paenibacillus lentus]AZK47685.1 hypothetical protein EIM92_17275 [Paenibacillus lentus]